MRRRATVWALMLLALSSVVCGVMAFLTTESQAGEEYSPEAPVLAPALLVTRTTPRPTPTPPPAPTTAPASPSAPTPGQTPRAPESNTPGSQIELRVVVDNPDWQHWWTVVQWQDERGQWHDVEGWQGSLDGVSSGAYGVKRWWVEKSDAGTGPFRWLVYASQNRQQRLASSAPFHLPVQGQFATVNAALREAASPCLGRYGYKCECAQPQQAWQGLDESTQTAMIRALCEPTSGGY